MRYLILLMALVGCAHEQQPKWWGATSEQAFYQDKTSCQVSAGQATPNGPGCHQDFFHTCSTSNRSDIFEQCMRSKGYSLH